MAVLLYQFRDDVFLALAVQYSVDVDPVAGTVAADANDSEARAWILTIEKWIGVESDDLLRFGLSIEILLQSPTKLKAEDFGFQFQG